jgi:hypothetical protein
MNEQQKRQDFLFIVQTTYLTNGINLSTHEDYANNKNSVRVEYSALAMKNEMCDAIKASYLLPNNKNAVDLAEEYINWKLFNDGTTASDRKPMPSWITPGLVDWEPKS